MDIKNLYDIYDDLKIVFSGSSALQIHRAEADLSRRVAIIIFMNCSLEST